MHGDWGWGWMLGGGALMIAFWGLVVWVVVTLVRRPPETADPRSPHGPGPEQILAERFARGEIDAEEYRRRLDTLRGT